VEICQGHSTTLNGSGGVTYSWSPSYGLSDPNISNPVANPGVTTTYTLTVTSGVCISTDNVVVSVITSPTSPSVTMVRDAEQELLGSRQMELVQERIINGMML